MPPNFNPGSFISGLFSSGGTNPSSASTDPETVMAQNRIQDASVLSVNPRLFYYMQFKFYEYNARTVYNIENDSTPGDGHSSTANIRNTLGVAANAVSGVAALPSILTGNIRGADDAVNNVSQLTSRLNAALDQGDTNNRQNSTATRAAVHQTLQNPLDTIVLPLPNSLIEQYSTDFQNGELGLIGRTVLDTMVRGGDLRDSIRATGLDPETYDRLATTVRDNIINSLPQGVGSAVTAGIGVVKNPVQAVIFHGIPLRQHQFSWKIIPESEAEQAAVMRVIDALRKHMLPPYETVGSISNIKYPDFCMVSLKPNLYKFPKPCFVSNISIDRTPDGFPAMHKDDNPIAYQISMTLLEATAVTRNDIIDSADTTAADNT